MSDLSRGLLPRTVLPIQLFNRLEPLRLPNRFAVHGVVNGVRQAVSATDWHDKETLRGIPLSVPKRVVPRAQLDVRLARACTTEYERVAAVIRLVR